jgi:hypothetical protein
MFDGNADLQGCTPLLLALGVATAVLDGGSFGGEGLFWGGVFATPSLGRNSADRTPRPLRPQIDDVGQNQTLLRYCSARTTATMATVMR